jgi:hypothetical protein
MSKFPECEGVEETGEYMKHEFALKKSADIYQRIDQNIQEDIQVTANMLRTSALWSSSSASISA